MVLNMSFTSPRRTWLASAWEKLVNTRGCQEISMDKNTNDLWILATDSKDKSVKDFFLLVKKRKGFPAMQETPLRLGRSPGGRNGNPLQYSCLGSTMDRGAWQATVHGIAKESHTTLQLNNNNANKRMLTLLEKNIWSTGTVSIQESHSWFF